MNKVNILAMRSFHNMVSVIDYDKLIKDLSCHNVGTVDNKIPLEKSKKLSLVKKNHHDKRY